MRPGRLDRLLYVQPPDAEGRKAILRINTSKMQVDPSLDLDLLAALVRVTACICLNFFLGVLKWNYRARAALVQKWCRYAKVQH